ncbi:hypothetical protein ACCO45_009916 [Purpureocillium lilacinum]|uniref:Uncharacterized protein n=1 Tax=Purpureocillium lilacinum TaxID=33203 RepID=A0ACC4DGC8_PURLI
MLSQMVRAYLAHTNDTSILDRALPLLVREHDFWTRNRSVEVRGPSKGPDGEIKTYTLSRFAVENTQPRPESFFEDYTQANNKSYYSPESGIIYPQVAALNDSQRAQLYSDLAAAAETGWDFGSRWLTRPSDSARDVYFPLRSLNTHNVVPVCLNSILYGNERAIGDFFALKGNDSARREWHDAAGRRSAAMHALMWNETLYSYFDYNISSSSQHIYVPADEGPDVDTADGPAPKGEQVLFHTAFARVARYLDVWPGGIPATNIRTGQQWDEPNVWPPLMHVLMQGLLNTPATFGDDDPAHRALHDLALRLAQSYLDSTFCTWYATGGSTSSTPKLEGAPQDAVGAMFEKYSAEWANVAGSGGEYEVVEGFGWTNGVLIWAADTFAGELKRPDCGYIKPADAQGGARRKRSARDASRTKKFGRRAVGGAN